MDDADAEKILAIIARHLHFCAEELPPPESISQWREQAQAVVTELDRAGFKIW